MLMLYSVVVLFCLLLWKLWPKKYSDPPLLSGWYPLVGHGYKLLGDGVREPMKGCLELLERVRHFIFYVPRRLTDNKEMYNSLVAMSRECVQQGGVSTLYLGPRKFYVIGDPDDCLTVMNSCLEKSCEFKRFFKPFLGNGLLVADAKRWHTSRRLLNPAFNQRVLDGFIDIFNSRAQELVEKFALEIGKPFDQDKLLRINSLESICSTSFDVPVNEYSDIFNTYLPLLPNILKRINSRTQKFWYHSDFIYNISPEKKLFYEDINSLVALSKTIIAKKKAERKNKAKSVTIHGNHHKFIDLLLDVAEETGCFTDEQIREETDNIIVDAHATTASTLTFVLTLLGSHTDVQKKLYEELVHVCGNSESIKKEDLSKLVYADAVLKETLRLYPIGLTFPRYTDRDVKLKNYTINANEDCLVMAHSLHRHSMWGPDADQFRPERWLHKETLPDHKYFGAFGLGRRACIGKVYAMMSMKITLAHVLRRYIISSDISKMVISLQMLATPDSGYYISLEQRQQLV